MRKITYYLSALLFFACLACSKSEDSAPVDPPQVIKDTIIGSWTLNAFTSNLVLKGAQADLDAKIKGLVKIGNVYTFGKDGKCSVGSKVFVYTTDVDKLRINAEKAGANDQFQVGYLAYSSVKVAGKTMTWTMDLEESKRLINIIMKASTDPVYSQDMINTLMERLDGHCILTFSEK